MFNWVEWARELLEELYAHGDLLRLVVEWLERIYDR